VLNRAPEAARSRALGFLYTANYIGNFLNPLVMTPVRHEVGNHQAFIIVGALWALGALAQAVVRRPVVAD
jgi:dipeptide/tripeptide permease